MFQFSKLTVWVWDLTELACNLNSTHICCVFRLANGFFAHWLLVEIIFSANKQVFHLFLSQTQKNEEKVHKNHFSCRSQPAFKNSTWMLSDPLFNHVFAHFLPFFPFLTEKDRKDGKKYFDYQTASKAPIHWSKYTAHITTLWACFTVWNNGPIGTTFLLKFDVTSSRPVATRGTASETTSTDLSRATGLLGLLKREKV